MSFLNELSWDCGIGPNQKLFNRASKESLILLSFLPWKHHKVVCKSVNYTVSEQKDPRIREQGRFVSIWEVEVRLVRFHSEFSVEI